MENTIEKAIEKGIRDASEGNSLDPEKVIGAHVRDAIIISVMSLPQECRWGDQAKGIHTLLESLGFEFEGDNDGLYLARPDIDKGKDLK